MAGWSCTENAFSRLDEVFPRKQRWLKGCRLERAGACLIKGLISHPDLIPQNVASLCFISAFPRKSGGETTALQFRIGSGPGKTRSAASSPRACAVCRPVAQSCCRSPALPFRRLQPEALGLSYTGWSLCGPRRTTPITLQCLEDEPKSAMTFLGWLKRSQELYILKGDSAHSRT